jgi:hypothetical protein
MGLKFVIRFAVHDTESHPLKTAKDGAASVDRSMRKTKVSQPPVLDYMGSGKTPAEVIA